MMMNVENYNPKHIYFKAYEHLALLENALIQIKERTPRDLQVSILGKVAQFDLDRELQNPQEPVPIRKYWKNKLVKTNEFGTLNNPEIGDIFVVGALTSTFLNRVADKSLGMLSVGPYGILRGVGASEAQATECVNLLKSGSFLLVLRAFEDELEIFKKILDEKKKV